MLKIMLAEDHTIVRNGIRMLLEADQNIAITGEANNGRAVIDMLKNGVAADILLTAISLPDINGMALIREVNVISPGIRVVFLTMLDDEKFVTGAFSEGASGYLLKNISTEELIFALRHVNSGGRYLCAELSMRLVDQQLKLTPITLPGQQIKFSEREKDVLGLMAEGLTNNEISEKLFISKRTVEGHRQSLMTKTSTTNTATLIRFCVLAGIVR